MSKERYRLQFLVPNTKLAICSDYKQKKSVEGDFFARAIKEETDVQPNDGRQHQSRNVYTYPMNIKDVISYISKKKFSGDMKRCLGLNLEDQNNEKVLFDNPIEINNSLTSVKKP